MFSTSIAKTRGNYLPREVFNMRCVLDSKEVKYLETERKTQLKNTKSKRRLTNSEMNELERLIEKYGE